MFCFVHFDDNYADEFDISGFRVFTDPEYMAWMNDLQKKQFPIECYFGTNESIEYKNLEAYKNRLTLESISKDEYNILKKLFPCLNHGAYGHFIDPSEYGDYDEDYEEIDEDYEEIDEEE